MFSTLPQGSKPRPARSLRASGTIRPAAKVRPMEGTGGQWTDRVVPLTTGVSATLGLAYLRRAYIKTLCLCVMASLLVLTSPLHAAEVNKRTHLAPAQQVKVNN